MTLILSVRKNAIFSTFISTVKDLQNFALCLKVKTYFPSSWQACNCRVSSPVSEFNGVVLFQRQQSCSFNVLKMFAIITTNSWLADKNTYYKLLKSQKGVTFLHGLHATNQPTIMKNTTPIMKLDSIFSPKQSSNRGTPVNSSIHFCNREYSYGRRCIM